MVRPSHKGKPRRPLRFRRQQWTVLLGFLLLLLAHATALVFRIQPAVSLWFPPSGVAIALTLWLGPIGAVLTGAASLIVAPLWGNGGWARLVSITDASEPLIAWFLFYRCFQGTLSIASLQDAVAFLISGPLVACGASAILGPLALIAFGKMDWASLSESIPSWWLGNAMGTMVIVPVAVLLISGFNQQPQTSTPSDRRRNFFRRLQPHWLEGGLVLGSAVFFALLTVRATQFSIFATLQFSLLSLIPVFWAVARFGATGSTLTASFSVVITLVAYLLFYPNAIALSSFPVDPELLYTHKLSLLLQTVIALLAGTAITERSTAQVALEVERIQRREYEARIQINHELSELNRLLTETNQRFYLASEAVNSAIYDWDVQQNQIQRTSGMDRVFGYAPEDIEATSDWFFALIHPDDRPMITATISQVLASGDRYNLEYRVRNHQGKYLYVADHGLLIRDESGQVIRIVGSVSDISDRKQIEIALNDAHERFQLAMAAINGMVYDYDIQRHYVERTEGLIRILGYTPDEVPPTPEWWHEQIHPDDQQTLPQSITETPTTEGRAVFEYRVRHRQGHYVYVMDQCIVLRDQAGNPVRMVGSTTDITARKQAAESLRQSEARLRRLVDANIVGIVEATLEQIIVANDAFLDLIGYSRDDILSGRIRWQEFTPPEYLERDQQALQELLDYGACTPFEKEYIRPDGVRVPVLIGAALVDPAPPTFICFVLDLSDRKKLELERAELLSREQAARQQAEAASHMKDEFLAIVSHELRSPLNGILGWSRLLRTRKLDPDTTEKALASIERNAQAQTQLIEDLLDISRIIRGKVRLNLRPVSLIPIIQASLDTTRPTAETKTIQLVSHLDTHLGLVLGDVERLQQIVWNLLSNALKFTPEGGKVEVQLTQVGTHARLQIIDTGQGISQEFLPYVFERFRQADPTTTRTQGGLGLGLAIVRNLVELHGGTIWVESAGVGQGSTFIIELPLLPTGNQQTNAEFVPTLPNDAESLAGLKVLIVDDEADTREFLATALEQFGANVTVAASAAEAFTLFQQNPPDVLLSDIGMPEEDGYALIQKIRALPIAAGGHTPAAALTAYVRGGDRLAALQAGFQLHVPKPIEPIQLFKVVSQLAAKPHQQTRP